MGADKPGWYYVGNGQKRYMDADGWPDQYKAIEDPYTPIDQPPASVRHVNTEPVDSERRSPAPANKPPDVKKPRRRMSPLVIAVCVGLVGVGGGLLKPDVFHGATSWAAEQAGQISALLAPPPPTVKAIAARPKVRPKVKPKVSPPKAVAPKAVASAVATHASAPKASPVTRAPAAIADFDKASALHWAGRVVEDIATADERFLDSPEIGTSTTMGFLSAHMGRLLNAGMPPVADKKRYYALLTTLEDFYAKAAYQLPDDVMGAAATYTAARGATSELLGLLNPVLGTKYALPRWSFM